MGPIYGSNRTVRNLNWEQTDDMINWIVRNRTVWFFNCVYQQNVFTNHIFNIHVKQELVLNNQKLLICHKKTTQIIYI